MIGRVAVHAQGAKESMGQEWRAVRYGPPPEETPMSKEKAEDNSVECRVDMK